MPSPVERILAEWLASGGRGIGQIRIVATESGLVLHHREDDGREDLAVYHSPNDAIELARFDDAGEYRALKTAPSLRHGWRLELTDLPAVRAALDFFYPGRLAALERWEASRLEPTPLREAVGRQRGTFHVAHKIS